jgi:hypothetical protein
MSVPAGDQSRDQIEALLASACGLPCGPARIGLCEEAVRLADTLNDVDLAYHARVSLCDAAMFGGRPDLTIVAFTWCVAQHDRNPDDFDDYQLLWRFKWLVDILPQFPQIDRPTIERMLDDMERRFQASGESLQPIWLKRRSVYETLGDLEQAAFAHRKYVRLARSPLSDCLACERDSLIDYYCVQGKNALGLKNAEKLFHSGIACAEVPHRTHATVLLPLLKAGRADEAMRHHRLGYALVKGNPAFGRYQGAHIAFLALTGNDSRVLRLLEKHVVDNLEEVDPMREFSFFRYAWLAVEAIAKRRKKAKLRLPPLSKSITGAGDYELADVAGEFEARALDLAKRFDKRNGNDYYTRMVKKTAAWHDCAMAFPFENRPRRGGD